MDLDVLIDRLERYILKECPRFLGHRMVNEDEVRSHLAQLRQAVPEEITRAREIIGERELVIESAREEAERIIARGREEAERLASSHQFVVDAQRQAKSIVEEARQEAKRLQEDADEYVYDALSRLQAELTRELKVVENGLHRLEAERESFQQERRM